MNINCLVIDDEPLARKGLKEYIADIDFLNCIGEYDTALKAAEQISSGEVQLLFLDIQMPKITGLEFLKRCKIRHPSFLQQRIRNMRWKGLK